MSASLWRHRDFMLLWVGQSVSEIGSSVTTVALPLSAVVVLKASTFEVGLLTVATTLPFLIVALPAGLVVDRITKRRLMLGCNIARALIIGSVPLAAALGLLTLTWLYGAALLAGIFAVFFDVAYQSVVPGLVGREQLRDGNGKLGATQSFAQVAGPGLGSGLFGLLGVRSLVVDALSYVVSAVSLIMIRSREPGERAGWGLRRRSGPAPVRELPARPPMRTELMAGVAFVLRHPVLRKIVACTAMGNLFAGAAQAVRIIFLVRVLRVPPAETGLLLAIGSLGGLAAGLVSGPLSRWIGATRIISVAFLGFGAVGLVMPFAEPGWRVLLFSVGAAGLSFAAVVYNIAQLSYRQLVTPPELVGRMNAAMRWIVWGTLPLGGLLGGALGSVVGVRTTVAISVLGAWAAGWFVFFSPLRSVRDVRAAEEPAISEETVS